MEIDNILEIGIDNVGRLYIKPETENFSMIYRLATEVHWDNNGSFLYSPKPREWSYFDWFKHMILVVNTECGVTLKVKADTIWTSIHEPLKTEILNFVR
jgi:hypothetical protein